MYSFIPIRICHLNDGNNDYRLSYCTNKGLIYAIGQIGKYRGVQKPRRSSYKIGLDYLATNLEINGEPVSRNEINPNRSLEKITYKMSISKFLLLMKSVFRTYICSVCG